MKERERERERDRRGRWNETKIQLLLARSFVQSTASLISASHPFLRFIFSRHSTFPYNTRARIVYCNNKKPTEERQKGRKKGRRGWSETSRFETSKSGKMIGRKREKGIR